ncbi:MULTISPECIES: aspartyl protease [Nostocales]|uniref:Aspartyl protease n=3 Tax=Nostocales TaxID=1161 RepID=A0A0C1RMZ8_9CYAN|nr:aspartyl protease [Tolypothrix bouteillei]KAF3887626.1 clan AA aspartic protease [Tolypothrix bouteillei VB521301]
MMRGFVNQSCEAVIRVALGRADAPKQMIEAVIDTGFTGFLSLPLATIESLGLPWIFRDVATLGDGSEAIFEMYRAIVIWDSQPQVVDVAASETDPLVGMSLLYGFKLEIETVEGGSVTIKALRDTLNG